MGAHTGNGCRVETVTCAMGAAFTSIWDGGGGGGCGVGGVIFGPGGDTGGCDTGGCDPGGNCGVGTRRTALETEGAGADAVWPDADAAGAA